MQVLSKKGLLLKKKFEWEWESEWARESERVWEWEKESKWVSEMASLLEKKNREDELFCLLEKVKAKKALIM